MMKVEKLLILTIYVFQIYYKVQVINEINLHDWSSTVFENGQGF